MNASATMLEAALAYAKEKGWHVFPCDGEKHPLTEHGLLDASTDEQKICRWWRRWPRANIAVACGPSGLVVVDKDRKNAVDGCESWRDLRAEHGIDDETVSQTTPSGGEHLLYAANGEKIRNSASKLAPGIDIRADGGYILVSPSSTKDGAYTWAGGYGPEEHELKPLPIALAKLLAENRNNGHKRAEPIPGRIPRGERNDRLASLAGSIRARGGSKATIYAALMAENENCDPPLDEEEIRRISESIAKYEPAAEWRPTLIQAAATGATLSDVQATFQKWLYLPDTGAVEIALGTAAANYGTGDPVWTLIVGPPGSGKTEILNGMIRLPQVHPVAVLSEGAFLSGVAKKDTAQGAKGGLLRELGDFGILLVKDFGGLLSMHKDARGPVLAALREVYDGSWTRYVGTDGGRKLHWEGKAGLLGGATPAIDGAYSVMASLGERFMFYRLPDADEGERSRWALRFAGREGEMRAELASAVSALFTGLKTPDGPPTLTDSEREKLIALAMLTTRCRSAVERDSSHTREIIQIPGAESPTRLVKSLLMLLGGLEAVGVDRSAAWKRIEKTALDSMPRMRRRALDVMLQADGTMTTTEIATTLDYPTTTTRRTLEDLACYGVVCRESQGTGRADAWYISTWTRETYERATTFPEIWEDIHSFATP